MNPTVILFLATALTACGVKSNLEKPPGAVLQMQEKDPSRPPVTLGEPTRVIPPYTTGP